MPDGRIGGSFRDPSGFVFTRGNTLYRQVNTCYGATFDAVAASGLFDCLWEQGLLVRHAPADLALASDPSRAGRVIQPQRVPFVSFPYEWSFGMYQAAALATLEIESLALSRGFTLKDASAYNIQFVDGQPVLIDTLSFERYQEGRPWAAYRQFCQHFLAPLALMARVDIRLGTLMKNCIDGLPLDLAARLLRGRARWNPGLLMHIHLHARSQQRHAADAVRDPAPAPAVGALQLRGILESLRNTVRKLAWQPAGTEWADYYTFTNYSDAAFAAKRSAVEELIAKAAPAQVWDLGANNGAFTRLAARRGIPSVAFDLDPAAVEQNYRMIRHDRERNLLPLVMDLANPSPALGWAGEERESLRQRGPVDLILALALIHHLAIGNNVPLEQIADYLASLCRHLVIEFVPKADSQVARLLATRPDIFADYTPAGFERAFARRFEILDRRPVAESSRILFLMRTRAG